MRNDQSNFFNIQEPAMNKTAIFSFIFLMMICGLAWTEPTEMEDYFEDLQAIPEIQPIDFCVKINSPTTGVSIELLFGTCADVSNVYVRTDLPPGTVDGTNPVDFYILHAAKAWDVFFTENRKKTDWTLVIRTDCILHFTLLGGALPGAGGSLKLYQGENELLNIFDGAESNQLAAGQYTIKYVPAPEKSTVEAEVTYTFQPGWNLLHLPIIVYEDTPREDDNWEELNALPRMTLSGRTYVKGGDIHCGEAFWVFYKDGDVEGNTLRVLGYEPLATDWPVRHSGWNFTGEKKNTDEVPANTYGWAADRYQVPEEIDSSKGYWIQNP